MGGEEPASQSVDQSASQTASRPGWPPVSRPTDRCRGIAARSGDPIDAPAVYATLIAIKQKL